MSQRIMLAVTIVLAITCLTATGMTWFVVNQGRTAAEAMAAESRAANAALLVQIAKLSAPPTAPPPSLEWNKVQVRLVTPDGKTKIPPGFTVSLKGNVLDAGKETSIDGTLGPEGTVEFGLVRAGHHQLRVDTGWGEAMSHYVDIRPGQPYSEEVTCPAATPQEAEIKITVDWPKHLRDKKLWVICDLIPVRREFNEKPWNIGPPAVRQQVVAINASGGILNFLAPVSGPGWANPAGDNSVLYNTFAMRSNTGEPAIGFRHPIAINRNSKNVSSGYHFGIENLSSSEGLRFPAVDYEPYGLMVATERPDETVGSIRDLQIVGAILESARAQLLQIRPRPSGLNENGDGRLFALFNAVGKQRFKTVAGQVNEWKISLPDELVKIVREQLAKAE